MNKRYKRFLGLPIAVACASIVILPAHSQEGEFDLVTGNYLEMNWEGRILSSMAIPTLCGGSESKIYLGGYARNSTTGVRNAVVSRLLADGSLDQFGSNGTLYLDVSSRGSEVNDIEYLCGDDNSGQPPSIYLGLTASKNDRYDPDFTVVKMNDKGHIDAQFGQSGRAVCDFNGQVDGLADLALAYKDQQLFLVAAGFTSNENSNTNMALAVWDRHGQPDSDFNGGGSVEFDLYSNTDSARRVAQSPIDGSSGWLTVTGTTENPFGFRRFAVGEVDAEGQLSTDNDPEGWLIDGFNGLNDDTDSVITDAVFSDDGVHLVGYSLTDEQQGVGAMAQLDRNLTLIRRTLFLNDDDESRFVDAVALDYSQQPPRIFAVGSSENVNGSIPLLWSLSESPDDMALFRQDRETELSLSEDDAVSGSFSQVVRVDDDNGRSSALVLAMNRAFSQPVVLKVKADTSVDRCFALNGPVTEPLSRLQEVRLNAEDCVVEGRIERPSGLSSSDIDLKAVIGGNETWLLVDNDTFVARVDPQAAYTLVLYQCGQQVGSITGDVTVQDVQSSAGSSMTSSGNIVVSFALGATLAALMTLL